MCKQAGKLRLRLREPCYIYRFDGVESLLECVARLRTSSGALRSCPLYERRGSYFLLLCERIGSRLATHHLVSEYAAPCPVRAEWLQEHARLLCRSTLEQTACFYEQVENT